MTEEPNKIDQLNSAWEVIKAEHGYMDLQDVRIEVYLRGGTEALANFDTDFDKREAPIRAVQGILSTGKRVIESKNLPPQESLLSLAKRILAP